MLTAANVYTSTDWQDWVRSIRETPEDDAPRLTCADWLDEHGEAERAEFVRAQIKLVRLPEPELLCIGGLFGKTTVRNRDDGRCTRCEDDRACEYHALEARVQELFQEDWFNPDGRLFNQVALYIDDYVPHRLYGQPIRGFIGRVRAPADLWLSRGDLRPRAGDER